MTTETTYGDAAAEDYDITYGDFEVEKPQLDLLVELAGNGRALEIGVGTGRVAIPLAQRSVAVTGLDPSQAMLDLLHEKDHQHAVTAYCGTLESIRGVYAYNLVYAPFNVLFYLPRGGSQEHFFDDAASVLHEHGYVAVECFVPRPGIRLVDGPKPAFFPCHRHIEVRSTTPKRIALLISENDQEQQVWQWNEVTLHVENGLSIVPSTIAYLMPDQIDAMAASAGFEIIHRYSDWGGTPFTQASRKHVTVYRKVNTPVPAVQSALD
jgi:SAM-dependent methyltransferase